MIPVEVVAVLPGTGPGGPHQCLRVLDDRLTATGRTDRQILSLTWFVNASTPAEYLHRKEALLTLVREALGPVPPPVSVVAQAPEGGRGAALEATLVAAPAAAAAEVVRRDCEGVPYTLATLRGARQLHGAGLCSSAGTEGTAAQAEEAFARFGALLEREGMTFGHVVRQWNYLEDMLTVHSTGEKCHQGYQAFCDVRALHYARSDFPAGYPAATGIGQSAGGVLLECIALDATEEVEVAPLSNPRQVDAHRYSPGVLIGEHLEELDGKAAPKFERAKRMAWGAWEAVLISGAAAILGEESVAPGDVAAQTRTAIENIAVLTPGGRLTHLRAYVKRSEDIPVVREVCAAAFGPIPALYVKADVCREELLVELEGAFLVSPEDDASGLVG